MIICPFCQTPHVDNTLFCDECGTYLQDEETRDTFPLEDDEPVLSPPPVNDTDTRDAPPASPSSVPSLVRLHVGNPPKNFEVHVTKTIYLGRLDPAANIYPEIDLTEENGLEYGVSRQHARLFIKNAQLYVEDLGSINGTLLNGHRLMAYLPEPITSGDTLQLGRLPIQITIEQ